MVVFLGIRLDTDCKLQRSDIMTKLTTKQFRAIVREEVAKFPGYIIDRSYTDNRKGPSSNLRSCAFYRIARKTSP